ncbi:thioesterase domain-containing protein, partial [Actinocorallia longicatena]|uniref:thioesterase domain-containing protein n=1 Tax=Actinocorallia longicatena TaxID=111803 RepID=UPI0031D2DF66
LAVLAAGLEPAPVAEVPPPLRGLVRRAVPKAAVAAAEPVARRVAALPEQERAAFVLTLVRSKTAEALGHAVVDSVDPDRPFREAGLDSLASIRLRNTLNEATGLRLPATATFDHPTPAALARHVVSGLGRSGHPGTSRLTAAFLRHCRDGRAEQAFATARAAAAARRPFGADDPPPVRSAVLAEGAGPRLICLPALLAPSGPHQYARISAHLDGRITALSPPGFQPGEPLAVSREALAATMAAAVREHAAGEPYALLGHSSGSWLAHAVATRLAGGESAPSGVVLLDPAGPAETTPALLATLAWTLWSDEHVVSALDDDSLTAMVHYFALHSAWVPRPCSVPVLVLPAAEATHGVRLSWPLPAEAAPTGGDHFTMLTDHAAATALRIGDWLRSGTVRSH